MSKHFRVGLTVAGDPQGSKLGLHVSEVFDDAVVDKMHFSVKGGVRVGIGFGDATVGCPTGMSDPHAGFMRSGQDRLKVPNFTNRPQHVHVAIVLQSDTG